MFNPEDSIREVNTVKGSRVINRKTREYLHSKEVYMQAVAEGLLTPLTEQQKNEHKWRRYVRPENPLTSLNLPPSGAKSRGNDGYGKMTSDQKKHFIDTLGIGAGKYLACDMCGITWAVFQRAMTEDREFKDTVNFKINAFRETIDLDIVNSMKAGQPVADKIAVRKLIIEIEAKEDTKRFKNRELKIKERAVDNKAKVVDHFIELSSANVKNLDTDELERYSLLFNRIKTGDDLSPDESVEYVRLTAKISTGDRTIDQDGMKMLNGVAAIDRMFDAGEKE